jgi:hypothetical protein
MGLRRKRITQNQAEEFLDNLKSLQVRLSDAVSFHTVLAIARTGTV